MKKIKFIIFSLTWIFIFLWLLSRSGANIRLSQEYQPLFDPAIIPVPGVDLKWIETAYAEPLEAVTYAGGSYFRLRRLSHAAILVIHPNGNILFDTGLGSAIDRQFECMPPLLKPLFTYEKNETAKNILSANKISIDKVFLSHMHWDHASGIEDFLNAPIVTTSNEYNYAFSNDAQPPGYLISQYDSPDIHWEFINFTSGSYEIFSESFDVYDDGSIVFVPLYGHSPGSLGMFVNMSHDDRYFFIGDITWTLEGITNPAEKFILSRRLADFDPHILRDEIVRIHQWHRRKPEITIVPAHDARAYEKLEQLKDE